MCVIFLTVLSLAVWNQIILNRDITVGGMNYQAAYSTCNSKLVLLADGRSMSSLVLSESDAKKACRECHKYGY